MWQPDPRTQVLAIEDDEEADDDDDHDQDGPQAPQVQLLVMVTGPAPGPGVRSARANRVAGSGWKLQILLEWQNIEIYFIAETLPVSPGVWFPWNIQNLNVLWNWQREYEDILHI